MISTPYIHDRALVEAAASLINDHGGAARAEAAKRAKSSRNRGNVVKFCHWRQIERLISVLDAGVDSASVH
jgi:hypothetical protein